MRSHTEIQDINEELHHTYLYGHACENWLNKCTAKVEDCISPSQSLHWLLMARLNEVSLLTAAVDPKNWTML